MDKTLQLFNAGRSKLGAMFTVAMLSLVATMPAWAGGTSAGALQAAMETELTAGRVAVIAILTTLATIIVLFTVWQLMKRGAK